MDLDRPEEHGRHTTAPVPGGPFSAISRRGFVASAAAFTAGTPAFAAESFVQRHRLEIGIQLYMLGPEVADDLDGALAAVAAIGYRQVELAGFLGRDAASVRKSLDHAGLTCPSVHVQGRSAGGADPSLEDPGRLADALAAVGARVAVMPTPRIPPRLGLRPAPGEVRGAYLRRVLPQFAAEDWKANADFLNRTAATLAGRGIRVGYHNHNAEFAPIGDTTGFEILLAETDPGRITFELDAGWATAAGLDPGALLARHPGRFSMMHVKDVKASTRRNYVLQQDPTEVGSGVIDWHRLLPLAHRAGVSHYFVEQEPPFERPRLASAQLSFEYLTRVPA